MPDMDDPSKDKSLNFLGENGGGFPIGMKVLAIDSNVVCLKLLVTLLQRCKYQVTATTKADEALTILKENKDIDLVITNVKRPDVDGFQLIEMIIGLRKDLPVVMLSADDDKESVMRGIRHGAAHYLLKPVRLPEIKNIWQHVVRKKMKGVKKSSIGKEIQCGEQEHSTEQRNISKCSDITNNSPQCNDEFSNKKRSRVKWTPELHQKFLDAVEMLGVSTANPKQIHELMGVKELTRDQVASHLQNYRTMLRKQEEDEEQEEAMRFQGRSSMPHISDNSNGATFGTFQNYMLNGSAASHYGPLGSSLMNFGSAIAESSNTSFFSNVYNQLDSFKPAYFSNQNQSGFTGYQGPVIQPLQSGEQLLQNCSRNLLHPQGQIIRPFNPNLASSSCNQLPLCNSGNVPRHLSLDHIQNSLIQAQNGTGQMCTADPVGIQGHQNIDQVPMLSDKGKKSLLPDTTEENGTTNTTMSHNTSEILDIEIDNPCIFKEDDIRALLELD